MWPHTMKSTNREKDWDEVWIILIIINNNGKNNENGKWMEKNGNGILEVNTPRVDVDACYAV